MGKRLVRIFSKEISSHIPSLLNTDLHLVLKNNTTLYGVLKSFENNVLKVEGGLREKHQVKLEEVVEIIYDKEAAY